MLTKQLGLFEISLKRSYVQYHRNQYFAEVHFQCTVAINIAKILEVCIVVKIDSINLVRNFRKP